MNFKYAIAGLVAAAFVAGPASADQIQGLYDTGVAANGTPLSNGAADIHYKVNGSGTPYVNQNPAYPAPSDARFISAQQDGGFSQNPNTYSLTFDLTGYNPATASLSGKVAADDSVVVQLNGTTIGSASGFGSLVSFAAMSGFVTGVNTLTFVVTDVFGPPSSLVVSGLQGSVSAAVVAAPGPIAGAGIPALLVIGGLLSARRRRSA